MEFGLGRKRGVQGLLAHPQFAGQIVHGDAAKTVGKKMLPRDSNDPRSGIIVARLNGGALSGSG